MEAPRLHWLRRRTLSDRPHDLDRLRSVALGVDHIRDLRTGVAERELRRLEAERLP